MKKTLVLIVLFILPLVVYLFFASGVNRFGRLPILSGPVPELTAFDTDEQFEDRITILGFLGSELSSKKGNAFNLNQKIYKRFYEFRDFQVLMVLPKGTESEAGELLDELSELTDTRNWRFVFGDEQEIRRLFDALNTDVSLDESLATPFVFIIDKDRYLRGRNADEDVGTKYGFNTNSVADLNNKMEDDVKIMLAEYRLALKKNQAESRE
jgi:hypothetical protein